MFSIHEHFDCFLPPRLLHFAVHVFDFGRVNGEFSFAKQQHAGVGDAFVEVGAGFFIQQGGLGFFEAVEGVGGGEVGGFVRMDEEGEGAVGGFYGGVGDAGLEVQDCVAGDDC